MLNEDIIIPWSRNHENRNHARKMHETTSIQCLQKEFAETKEIFCTELLPLNYIENTFVYKIERIFENVYNDFNKYNIILCSFYYTYMLHINSVLCDILNTLDIIRHVHNVVIKSVFVLRTDDHMINWNGHHKTDSDRLEVSTRMKTNTDTRKTQNGHAHGYRITNNDLRKCENVSKKYENESKEYKMGCSRSEVKHVRPKNQFTYILKKHERNVYVIMDTFLKLLLISSIANTYMSNMVFSRFGATSKMKNSVHLSSIQTSDAHRKDFLSDYDVIKSNSIILGTHRSTHHRLFSSNLTFNSEIQLYPASLNSYFDEMQSDRILAIEEIMKYEWNRVRSFRNFPRDSPAYAIQLARAGFYYGDHGDEVVCFSCGTRHSNWRRGDSPVDVHRRISPNCQFINGHDSRNVPISNVTTGHDMRSCEASPPINNGNAACESYTRTESEVSCNGVNNNVNNYTNNNNITGSRHYAFDNGLCSETMGHRTKTNSAGQECIASTLRTMSSSYSSNRSGNEGDDGFARRFVPNTSVLQAPRYPRYEVLAVRISSFNGWPVYSGITPHSLAQAGLFYVGFGDCVRCYYCGGGLRNWQPRDLPSVEHARWYPRCPLVIQSQGGRLVHDVIRSHHQEDSLDPETGLDEVSLPLESANEHQNSSEPDVLSSTAAQSAIEMGYSQETVQDAFRQLREQRGTEMFSAQALLSLILENEENGQEVTTPSAHYCRESNTTCRNFSEKHDDENEDNVNPSVSHDSRLSLMEENRLLKEQNLCKVCLVEPCCIVLLPCGHLVTCSGCASALKKCPICRKKIKGTVKAYLS